MIGDKDSDIAIILPMRAGELAAWRRKHPEYTYWCGTLLGGCGEPLTDRLYLEKVCHFAHHPHHTCTRTATGEASADHLFMHRTLRQWLPGHGLGGGVRWTGPKPGPASGIDVVLPGRRGLRFRLGNGSEHLWGPTAETVAPGGDDWVFGLGMPVPRTFFDEQGYVFRIKFETRGAERCPYLGVQQPVGGIDWAPFTEAVLTEDGLTTPVVREIRATRARTSPPTAPAPPSENGSAPRELDGDDLVLAIRSALELHARWGSRTTWNRLMQTVGTDLSGRGDGSLRAVLVAVDRVFHRDDPVLSALIRTDSGEPLPYLPQVLDDLGFGLPSSKAQLKRWCLREADRAFAKYGVPPRTVPPSLPLEAAVPEVLVLLDTPLPSERRKPSARSTTTRAAARVTVDRSTADRTRLEKLIAEGRALAGTVIGRTEQKRLAAETQLARRFLKGIRQSTLNKHGTQLLRQRITDLEAAVAAARRRGHYPEQGPQSAGKPSSPAPAPRTPPKTSPTSGPAPAGKPAKRLRDHLTAVARKGSTVAWPLLPDVPKDVSDAERCRLLVAAERVSGGTGAPLLSALVVAPGERPPAYFRLLLGDLGFAVPVSDEVLVRIWRREQERAHAAHAVPPRHVPDRLVPRASEVRGAGGTGA
ncbi:hypothetical protein [Kitasatospora sp. NPDC004272]